jgi:hypothetical protein
MAVSTKAEIEALVDTAYPDREAAVRGAEEAVFDALIDTALNANGDVSKTTSYTVVINTDSGKKFHSTGDITYTLPSIAIGNVFTFVNDSDDGEATITISPAALDGISYVGDATDNKDLILASANKGDYVTIASLDQTVAWQVVDIQGTGTKEA